MVQRNPKTSTVPFAPKHGRVYMVGGRIHGAEAFQNEHRTLIPAACAGVSFNGPPANSMLDCPEHKITSPKLTSFSVWTQFTVVTSTGKRSVHHQS
jgi:hypothetical protein